MSRTGRDLLENVIGTRAINDFDVKQSLTLMIRGEYYIFTCDGQTVRVNDSHMQIGHVDIKDRDVYDIIYSIIEGINTGKISFGCGKLEIKLPKVMPPRTLSFWSYLVYRRPKWTVGVSRTLVSALTLPAILTALKTKVDYNWGSTTSMWNEGNTLPTVMISISRLLLGMSYLIANGYIQPLVHIEDLSKLGAVAIADGLLYTLIISLLDLGIGLVIHDYKKWKAKGGILD